MHPCCQCRRHLACPYYLTKDLLGSGPVYHILIYQSCEIRNMLGSYLDACKQRVLFLLIIFFFSFLPLVYKAHKISHYPVGYLFWREVYHKSGFEKISKLLLPISTCAMWADRPYFDVKRSLRVSGSSGIDCLINETNSLPSITRGMSGSGK